MVLGFELNPETSAMVFNRAGDLEARIQFLKGRKGQKDNLLSGLRLIGEGVVELSLPRISLMPMPLWIRLISL